jgi:dienelactone hydrolase
MRVKSLLILVFASIVAMAPVHHAAAESVAPERVAITDAGLTLQAYVLKPAGSGPFPVVVAMSDCGGLTGNGNVLRASYQDWAQRFNAAGFAVLFPDGLGSRDLNAKCGAPNPKMRPSREGAADIAAVRQWLTQQDWVVPGRLTLVGWGEGGSAVLWAVRPQVRPGSGPDFRSAVALYPVCQRLARLGWSSRVPMLVLTGSKRDVAATKACQQMVDNAKGRSALAQFSVYPDQADVVGSAEDAAVNSSVVRSLVALGNDSKRVIDWLKR